MSSGIHQTVSSATFLKSIQYHLCVGCHPWQQSGHLSLTQILLEDGEMEEGERKWRGTFFYCFSQPCFSVKVIVKAHCDRTLCEDVEMKRLTSKRSFFPLIKNM